MFDVITREVAYIGGIGRSLRRMRHVAPDSPLTIVDTVDGFAATTPDAPAILCGADVVSYRALVQTANRVAHWAHGQGIGKGDAVALLMENRPEYIAMWLGLLKVGAIASLLNTNLRGAPLAHSIAVSDARHAIVGAELAQAYGEARPLLQNPPVAWIAGLGGSGGEDLDAALAAASPDAPDPGWRA